MHSKFPRSTCISWLFALQKSFTSRATLPLTTPKKSPIPQKNPASAIKWLGLGVIQVSIFEMLLLQGKVKTGRNVSVSASLTGQPLLMLASHIPF